MTKSTPLNLVLELGETYIPVDPCKLPCVDKHYVVVRPGDYNKRKKIIKHGARWFGFTIKADTEPAVIRAVLADAKTYHFKNG